MGRNERYELESLLSDLQYSGYLIIPLVKLLRLLGKGNRAAGTWVALLEVWEELDGDRNDLHMVQTSHDVLIITNAATEPVKDWAK